MKEDRLDDDVEEVCYIYSQRKKGLYRYEIRCAIPPGLDDPATIKALGCLYESCVLEGLAEGADYRWHGIDRIAFKDDGVAALFVLSLDTHIKKL